MLLSSSMNFPVGFQIVSIILASFLAGTFGFNARGPFYYYSPPAFRCRSSPFYSSNDGDFDKYSQKYRDYDDNYNSMDENYWSRDDPKDDEEDFFSDKNRQFDSEDTPPLEWELCEDESTMVLLPPPYVDQPTGIIHFVGGTFFGSSPKLWYGSLLEEIVRGTNCAVVATSIPITIAKNPLHHVKLSRNLQRKFQIAFNDVLEDEYGDAIEQVPIVALGHSLGARLLTVLATLEPTQNFDVPKYKSYILLSFTNYGAAVSIPGVDQLLKSRQELDNEPQRRRRQQRRRSKSLQDDRYDYYGSYDDNEDILSEEIEEMMGEIKDSVMEQAEIVRETLTPKTKQLEFFPSPNQLWDGLAKDHRYSIPETLLIHFDNDDVDQSAKLATCLTNSTNLRYAFLCGTHLSPISVDAKDDSWMELPSMATKALWDLVSGQKSRTSISKKSRTESENMENLRQTIITYLTDVATVTK